MMSKTYPQVGEREKERQRESIIKIQNADQV